MASESIKSRDYGIDAFRFISFLGVVLRQYEQPIYGKELLYTLVTGSPGFHLWFFPALGVSGAILILVKGRVATTGMIVLGALLYIVGLALGAYKGLLGLDAFWLGGHEWQMRFGPFMGFPFMLIGYLIAKYNVRINNGALLVGLMVLGVLIQLAEMKFLSRQGLKWVERDILIGTLIYGTAFFLLARRIGEGPLVRALAKLGMISMGAYCVHVSFLLPLKGEISNDHIGGVIPLFALVAIISLAVSWCGTKIPMLRNVFV